MLSIGYTTDPRRQEIVFGLLSVLNNPLTVDKNQKIIDALQSYSMLLLDLTGKTYSNITDDKFGGDLDKLMVDLCPTFRLGRVDTMEHEIEIIVPGMEFSTNYETGTICNMLTWMKEQGKGLWSFTHGIERAVGHKFRFYFEDLTSAVWFKMANA